MQIATFDFHNTVAHCDSWFQLEIRDLPVCVLDLLEETRDSGSAGAFRQEATERYRTMRQGIMQSGIEVDALDSVERVFVELGITASRERIAAAIDHCMKATIDEAQPVPGAVETIEAILDEEIPVGVISSAVYHPFLEWTLERFGLRDRLAFVATSASVGYYKSDVRIYTHTYAAASATLDLGVHLGDSPRWDVDTAKQAGLGAVLFADTPEKRDAVGSNGFAPPDLIVDNLVGSHDAVLALLERRRRGAGAP